MAWTPITIGDVKLQHRVVLAPLTRGRASPSAQNGNTWIPNELMKRYYTERATPGGLMISEATPVSVRASGLPGIPGLFTTEQETAWKPIVSSVHSEGSIFFSQLWHQGRNTHSSVIGGQSPESSSDEAIDGELFWNDVPRVKFEKPRSMTKQDIQKTQEDFVKAAEAAREAGFDGIEIHGGNGYLFDQFHHTNINKRTDEYGGSIENRCRFTLETVDKLCQAIGSGRVAVRLTPFGLFNQTFGEDRIAQWTYLCEELSKRNLAYVHLIEPRFDEFKGAGEKALALSEMSLEQDISLAPFRKALGGTPLISAGAFGPDNYEQGIKDGSYDLVAFGRYFVANPDLVQRLKSGQPLYKWDRSRFYGPFPDNEIGYTVHTKRDIALSSDRLKAQLAE